MRLISSSRIKSRRYRYLVAPRGRCPELLPRRIHRRAPELRLQPGRHLHSGPDRCPGGPDGILRGASRGHRISFAGRSGELLVRLGQGGATEGSGLRRGVDDRDQTQAGDGGGPAVVRLSCLSKRALPSSCLTAMCAGSSSRVGEIPLVAAGARHLKREGTPRARPKWFI